MAISVSAPAAAPVTIFDNSWATTLAFAASLGRRGIPLHFFGSGAGRWSRYATRREPCPPIENAARFLPWLRQRIRCGQVARVAPTTDLIAFYLAQLRDEFEPAVQRTIAPLDEMESSLIKTRFAARCERIGQPVPAQAAPAGVEEAVAAAATLGYPLIIKPKSHIIVGWLERGSVIRDEGELRRRFRAYAVAPGQEDLVARYPELRWPLLQRYVPSARTCVYSVSGFKDADRGIVAACLSYKKEQWPPDVGISTNQVASADARVLQAGLASVDQLVSCGLFELEFLADGQALLAIDLNQRAFGFINLDIARGNDLPWLWYRSTLGPMDAVANNPGPGPIEARLVIPYWTGHAIRRLFGNRPAAAPRGAAGPAPWVSMLGSADDLLPLVLSHLQLLRHPGSLLRPFIAAAWGARGGAVG